ncbi:class I SAM-dependent methyltransferase [Alicyclobacillus sp. ALC3]|uniref:class I SAM-dependent methyltransferase n=1 Tax=Alicyclobacillus sp. ALC3 TaxID=2796143 RepID=UPI002379EE32|nr:class I SAM-dependent methyltransferase [Alicyclobacillus sp. ALC3]WDL99036.1 class I SAM-dependent methyltransferase [Alicyclobacillus sp. ALC3]
MQSHENTPAQHAVDRGLRFEQLPQRHTDRYQSDIRVLLPTYDGLHTLVDAYLRPFVPDDGRVLVVGAGGGTELITLGLAHPNWTFTAVDPAANMLASARSRTEAAGVAERVRWCCGAIDATNPHLHDAATCILVLHFVAGDDERRTLLQGIASRLREGSPLILVSAVRDDGNGDLPSAVHSQALYDGAIAATGQERLAAKLRQNIEQSAAIPGDRLKQLLVDTGFSEPLQFFQTYQFVGWLTTRT